MELVVLFFGIVVGTVFGFLVLGAIIINWIKRALRRFI